MSSLNMEPLLRRDKKKRYRSSMSVFSVMAAFLLLVAFMPAARTRVGRAVFAVGVRPLLLVAEQTRRIGEAARAVFAQKHALIERNALLEEQTAKLSSAALERDAYASELKELRSLLGRSGRRRVVLGSIIFYPRDATPDTMIIDAGTRDGVNNDMRVSAFGDVLIGKVQTAFERQSVVNLISSAGFSINATLARPQLAVVAEGRGGGNLSVTLPKSFSVNVGEQVYTSETTPLFIGVVEDIAQSRTGATQELFVRLPFNVHVLRTVFVIIEES